MAAPHADRAGTVPGHIDVHQHYFPDFYVAALHRAGRAASGGAPLPDWSEADCLSMLDRRGIETAVLSLAPPGVQLGDPAGSAELAARCNDYLAELCARHPGRLGGFGALPLPDVPASLAEIARVYDDLGLDGVGLLTNVAGRYLGDPEFEPVFAELGRREAVVYLHPVEPVVDPAPSLGLPGWFAEFPFDTTRTLTDLILRGTLERHDGLRLIVAHAGGAAPFIVNRINNVWRELPGAAQRAPAGVTAYLRRLYYDTASCGAGYGLRLVRDLAGVEQIVLGSDYPFVPEHAVTALADRLADPLFLGTGAATLRDNALRLLPRLAKR
ncbi:amidohydrolase family protein [Dactylosporangium fulvum]|uniref:Amidohydrolase n=1 Tax=Dactylosporangium fulvum TaxID=53359 RepID=A0ABY5WAF1_9ACTN|nr:amidohydrolase family protein [Dactylosporangium fulvum]UWP86086.1 amidohydrolase [Dactylosporangium fulvum]